MGGARRVLGAALALGAVLLLLLARLPAPRPAPAPHNRTAPPGAGRAEPLAGQTEPVVVETKPAAVETKPAVVETKPAAVEAKPAAVEAKPAAVETKPAAVEGKSAVVDSKPVAVEGKSAVVDSKPVAVETKPVVVETKPVAVESKPVAVESKPARGVVLTRDVYAGGHARAHAELCPALGARVRLLVLVTSAPAHAAARAAVRLTWGHFAARADVALAFALGAPPAALAPALAAEDALYGDLVMGRSLDSYSNLTLKTLSMLEWADTYCPRAPRVLKTDDDMFINVPRLLEFAAAPHRANATRTIWGKVVHRSLPKRTTKSKYYVSPLQYPGKVFPDFATGPAYLMTADCVRPLLRAAGAEPYLRLEDVFVTGVLASRLGIKRVHAPEFYNKKVAAHPCAIQRGVAVHMVRYHEQFDLWRKLLDGTAMCAT